MPAIVPQVTLLPRFFSTYVEHVCPMRPAPRCIEQLVAPDVRQQARILQRYDDIQKKHDIRGVQGLVLDDLLCHDEAALQKLLKHVDMYNQGVDYISEQVRKQHSANKENSFM